MSGELRIGDAERDRAMAVLREHFAQGRLSREELDERLDLALAARTARDLTAVTADLPVDEYGHAAGPDSLEPGYGTAHTPRRTRRGHHHPWGHGGWGHHPSSPGPGPRFGPGLGPGRGLGMGPGMSPGMGPDARFDPDTDPGSTFGPDTDPGSPPGPLFDPDTDARSRPGPPFDPDMGPSSSPSPQIGRGIGSGPGPWLAGWQAEAERRGLRWPDHDPAAWHAAMRAHRREMHRIRHDMRRHMRHSPHPWAHRHGPGPFVPILLLAAVIGLIVGGFGFFKVVLALWIGATAFHVIRRIAHGRRFTGPGRAGL
ncbi:DUF1707 SHOCT-like domain-containing protein [Nonomuraea soli]|uniref:DUF1707 domain-containing protein n=1 Tax=Nonomuraea soli TaxID=1032476 RepID=A0A7W0CNP5_9ACTN|nr:DUF1707 domain-containing protein [Nonomuraea soli]MBA2894465.1 hypothetical protein [Nonomuraea soli]